jgi:hypothetical protein
MRTFKLGLALIITVAVAFVSSTGWSQDAEAACGCTGTEGKQVDRAFFEDVLKQLNDPSVPVTDFAVAALQQWQRVENTRACWNPLATTQNISGRCCNFNSSGVKSYSDRESGVRATAITLNQGYVKPIREMLAKQAFNETAITSALNKWSGNGGYVPGLVKKWRELYGAPSGANADVALIIDSSGSMSWNDPPPGAPIGECDPRYLAKRHDAARAYLGASSDGDQVAVVDFDEDVVLASPLRRIPDGRTDLIAAINTADSCGSTNMVAGIQTACQELKDHGNTSHKKGAILLTDGRHNVGTWNDPQSCFTQQGWPIYVFSLGSDIDAALLQRIADETGGAYKPLPTSGLMCEFQRVRSLIAGVTPAPCQTTHVNPGQTVQYLASVPPGQGQATFSANWPGSDVAVSLASPSGRQIGPNTTDPDVFHDEGDTFELYRIQNPEAGDWTVQLLGADLPPSGEDVVIAVTTVPPADSTPPTSQLTQRRSWSSPMPIDLTFEATDPSGPGGEEPSGVKHVELWYRYRGLLKMPPLESPSPEQIRPQDMALARGWSGWAQYDGTYAASPIPFTLPSGSGLYEFYTVAVDNAGNREESPATADARYLCVVHGERGWCVSVLWVPPVGLPKIIHGSPFGR